MAELEQAVLANSVPVVLQRRFMAKLFTSGEMDFGLSSASGLQSALWLLRLIDAVSMHLNEAFRQRNPELMDVWQVVDIYKEAHRRVEKRSGNMSRSCNETVVSNDAQVYVMTATHCTAIWEGRIFSSDTSHDVAVRYILPDSGSAAGSKKERLPVPLPALYLGDASGRLVVLDAYGFDYVWNVVRKVYFSFALPENPRDPETAYWMLIPLKESARRLDPQWSFLAEGVSGTGIADAETGQVVGVASGAFLIDSKTGSRVDAKNTEFWPCSSGCFTVLRFTSARSVLKLLPESRRQARRN